MRMCLLCLLVFVCRPAFAEPWRYVAPSDDSVHAHPPFRVLILSSERPKDLQETVRYRGTRQRYAQFRYASLNSPVVAIVLDQASETNADLYVDRNGIIEPQDRVQGTGGRWRLPLDVAIVDGTITNLIRREVTFRLGRTGRTLSFAACGYLEGKTRLGDGTYVVRRMDGDGNGFFADPQDQIWIDLNQDGQWDAVDEQFLYAPILQIGPRRYAVRSDQAGNRLTFEELKETGTVQLVIKRPGVAARLLEVTTTLTSQDGITVSLRQDLAKAVLPIGEYQVIALTISLADPDGGPKWNYVFYHSADQHSQKSYHVRKDELVLLDPIGGLNLQVATTSSSCSPGKEISVQPQLFTGDRLSIVTVFRGDRLIEPAAGGCHAEVSLRSMDGQFLSAGSSGFA